MSLGHVRLSRVMSLPLSLEKNLDCLRLLCDGKNCSPELRKSLLRQSSLALIAAICNCAWNILTKRFPITSSQFKELKKHRVLIHKLSDPKKGLVRKRSIIVKHCEQIPVLVGIVLVKIPKS